jgi:hypothetical protein
MIKVHRPMYKKLPKSSTMQYLFVESRKNKTKKQGNIFIRHQLCWELQEESHYNATDSESLTGRWKMFVTAICFFRFQINSTWRIAENFRCKMLWRTVSPSCTIIFVRFSLHAACGVWSSSLFDEQSKIKVKWMLNHFKVEVFVCICL